MPYSKQYFLQGFQECCLDFPQPGLVPDVANRQSGAMGITLDASRVAQAPPTWRSFVGFLDGESPNTTTRIRSGPQLERNDNALPSDTILSNAASRHAVCQIAQPGAVCFVNGNDNGHTIGAGLLWSRSHELSGHPSARGIIKERLDHRTRVCFRFERVTRSCACLSIRESHFWGQSRAQVNILDER